MEALIARGLQVVVLLQGAGWAEAPMRIFTFLGTADFFFLILPAVYWCVDAGLGARVAFILLFSNGLNEIVKLALQGPRPYWISAQVKALAAEPSFGVPSGHAQDAAAVWGTIAAASRRRWIWVVASMLVLLIGLSRIYLGVHFPHDVLVGWLIGGLVLWGFLGLWERAATWVKSRTLLQLTLLLLVVVGAFLAVDAWLVHGLRGYALPSEWVSNAARAGSELPPHVSVQDMLTSGGAFFGLAFGLAWISRHGGYQPSGPMWKRLVCFLIGLGGVLILYIGAKVVLPSEEGLVGSILRIARYAAIGLWITGGAPAVFRRLALTEKAAPRR